MRKTTIIESVHDLPKLAGLWRELYRRLPDATHFQQFEINRAVAEVFADRERLHVAAVEEDGGAAIIPAVISENEVRFIGEELFDYPNVLASSAATLTRAWDLVERLGLPMHLHGVRERVSWGDTSPFTGAPFRSATDIVARHERFERNLRKLTEQGCERRTFTRGAELERLVEQMYTRKAAQRNGTLFRDALRVRAVVAMCGATDPELHVYMHGATLVAGALTFMDRSVCRFYGTYYDERWRAFSPGATLLYNVVRQAQARGLEFDFMTGEQPYKKRFATGVKPLFRVERVPAVAPLSTAA